MRNLVFQVDIKGFDFTKTDFWRHYHRHDRLYKDSKQKAMFYAKKVNADYLCLTRGLLPETYAPNYQKLSFYYFFEKFNYDKIFLLDCDAIIQDSCPNIFEYDTLSGTTNIPEENDPVWPVLRNKFNFPPESTPLHLNSLEGQELPKDYKKYFCSGVVLITRDFYEATKDHWISELEYCNTKNNLNFKDQTVLNKLAEKHYPNDKINLLSEEWGAWWKEGKYINHVTDGRREQYAKINFSS